MAPRCPRTGHLHQFLQTIRKLQTRQSRGRTRPVVSPPTILRGISCLEFFLGFARTRQGNASQRPASNEGRTLTHTFSSATAALARRVDVAAPPSLQQIRGFRLHHFVLLKCRHMRSLALSSGTPCKSIEPHFAFEISSCSREGEPMSHTGALTGTGQRRCCTAGSGLGIRPWFAHFLDAMMLTRSSH
jgi:hypothetical protein